MTAGSTTHRDQATADCAVAPAAPGALVGANGSRLDTLPGWDAERGVLRMHDAQELPSALIARARGILPPEVPPLADSPEDELAALEAAARSIEPV